eukprot:CAMPEP_0173117564 /NCGR_PEP_ID=MMETSP1102-20130122/50358_1 /TAXON_ID=49646 /ORGANISM="Geminigera sp., Strain Caron Lab Isolate" /LENGTH=50 /DNA_ID=CAMNT_0014022189 /DNA_START=69 /DNA_END=221 /DNA_ORIENTATION=-
MSSTVVGWRVTALSRASPAASSAAATSDEDASHLRHASCVKTAAGDIWRR